MRKCSNLPNANLRQLIPGFQTSLPKGKLCTNSIYPHGKLDHANDTFRIRKMRNIPAKLQEAQKLDSLGKTNTSEFDSLIKSIHQSQFFTPGQSLSTNDDDRQAQCRSRINKWKAELQSSTQACYVATTCTSNISWFDFLSIRPSQCNL